MPVVSRGLKTQATDNGSATSVSFTTTEAPVGALAIVWYGTSSQTAATAANDFNAAYPGWTQINSISGSFNNTVVFARLLTTAGLTLANTTGTSRRWIVAGVYTGHALTSISNLKYTSLDNTSASITLGDSIVAGSGGTSAAGNGHLIVAVDLINYGGTDRTDTMSGGTLKSSGTTATASNNNDTRVYSYEDDTVTPEQPLDAKTFTISGGNTSYRHSTWVFLVEQEAVTTVVKSDSDSATASDDATLTTNTALTESGTASDDAVVVGTAGVTDSATGSDDVTSLGLIADDSGVGSDDVFEIFRGVLVSDSDSGTADDTATALSVTTSASDDGVGTDTPSVFASSPVSDAAVGTESDGFVTILVTESGVGTDTTTDQRNWDTRTETGIADDTIGATYQQFLVFDSGIGTDTADRPADKVVINNDFIQYPDSVFYTRKRFRILAQRISTGEWVHNDVPLIDPEITYQYSNPHLFRGTLKNEVPTLQALSPALEPEDTWLYPEEDGQILGSFILLPPLDNNATQSREVEAVGFTAYPDWIEYQGDEYKGVQVDPAFLYKMMWNHIQSFRDGDLGVIVNPNVTTPVRLGTAPKNVEFTTGEGEEVSFEAGPYDLNWWEVTNLGQAMGKLLTDTPMEYIEVSAWNANKTAIYKYVDLRYPRVGTRRDAIFREGENLIEVLPSFNESKDGYPSDIIVVGAGEGKDAIRGYVSRYTGRIRRTKTIQDEKIKTKEEALARAQEEARRIDRARYGVDSIVVNLAHINAPLGSFQSGDDIYLKGKVIYRGAVEGYFRIASWIYVPGSMRATLSLAPSETFAY